MPEDSGAEQVQLRKYLDVLLRRKMLIGFVTLLSLGAGFGLSFRQTPIYEARAPVLLQPRNNQSVFSPDAGVRLDPGLVVETEIAVLASGPVREEVVKKIGPVGRVRVTQVRQTLVVEVRARDRDPARAAQAATTYAETFIDLRSKQRVDQILSAGTSIRAKIAETDARIAEIDKEAAATNRADPNVQRSIETRRLALIGQQTLFRQKLDQLEVDASINAGGAQLLAPAAAPGTPVQPKPVRNGLLGGIVGLLLGIGLAALFEALDDSIKTTEELRLIAEGLPVLAAIPTFPTRLGLAPKDSGAAEAYRAARTSLQLLRLDHPVGVVQISSSGPGEGKTTTLANLAVALSANRLRVLMIDCDLRRPRLHKVFGVQNSVGLTSVLSGKVSLRSAIQKVPGDPRLVCLPAGPAVPNPSELLSSSLTAEVMRAVKKRFDVVLVDCPPALVVTDAVVVASCVDATIVVAQAGKTTRRQLRSTIEHLSQVEGPLRVTLLNRADTGGSYGYSYRYERPRSDQEEPVTDPADEREVTVVPSGGSAGSDSVPQEKDDVDGTAPPEPGRAEEARADQAARAEERAEEAARAESARADAARADEANRTDAARADQAAGADAAQADEPGRDEPAPADVGVKVEAEGALAPVANGREALRRNWWENQADEQDGSSVRPTSREDKPVARPWWAEPVDQRDRSS